MPGIAILALFVAQKVACSPAPLTAEELFRGSVFDEVGFSPDGRHLGAVITDEDDTRNLLILDTRNYKPLGLRAGGYFEIGDLHWLDNERVVFSVRKDKLYSWGLYSAKVNDLERYTPINRNDVTRIVGIPLARPGHVLVWILKSSNENGRPGRLEEFNAGRTVGPFESWQPGEALVRLYDPPSDGPVTQWDADRNGELALCQTWANRGYQTYHYAPASNSWSRVNLPHGARPMGVDFDSRFLWVVTISAEKAYELRRLNMEDGLMEAPVLIDRFYDIGTGRLFFSERQHALAGLEYLQRRPFAVWFQKTYAVAQASVDKVRPATNNVLVACDRAEREFLFACGDAQHPATYVLLDLDARTLTTVGSAAPWLAGKAMHPVAPMSFLTRDGSRLEGYVALPEGASREHPVPLVVLVHGGPYARDDAAFNPEVQFLASRGYAVIQPNYRGSKGYSPTISSEYDFNFRRMHDDVTDATRAMLRTGIIDPKRVAIMGASFGGYLAVAGVALEKDLYRCAITESGVFDWERLIKSKQDVARPGEYQILTDELGMPGRDSARLRDISPIDHADQIQVPVLIAHGAEDNIVDVGQSERLVRELKRRGVPCETFFRDSEGHGFYNYDNRVEFYHRVENFLAANLGGASLADPRQKP
jgi:acetyl esterase/lipase